MRQKIYRLVQPGAQSGKPADAYAIYWAVILLTTVGYGDVLATTFTGKLITILSALMGIAVVALPAGLITAGYLEELRNEKDDSDQEE